MNEWNFLLTCEFCFFSFVISYNSRFCTVPTHALPPEIAWQSRSLSSTTEKGNTSTLTPAKWNHLLLTVHLKIPLLLLVWNGFIICPADCQELTVLMNLALGPQISSLFYLHAQTFNLANRPHPALCNVQTFSSLFCLLFVISTSKSALAHTKHKRPFLSNKWNGCHQIE